MTSRSVAVALNQSIVLFYYRNWVTIWRCSLHLFGIFCQCNDTIDGEEMKYKFNTKYRLMLILWVWLQYHTMKNEPLDHNSKKNTSCLSNFVMDKISPKKERMKKRSYILIILKFSCLSLPYIISGIKMNPRYRLCDLHLRTFSHI